MKSLFVTLFFVLFSIAISQVILTSTFGFGANQRGQIARKNPRVPAPVTFDGIAKSVKLMCSGLDQVVVVTTDNIVYTWGSNVRTSLGINNTNVEAAYFTPTNVQGSQFIVSSLSCGDEHVVMFSNSTTIRGFGNVVCLGAGATNTSYIVPNNIPAVQSSSFTSVWAFGRVTFFKDGTGKAWATGDNNNGQLGETGGVSRLTAALVPRLTGVDITKVVGSTTMTVALDATGALWISGRNANGELGLNRIDSFIPVANITKHEFFVTNSLTVANVWSAYRSTFVLVGTTLYGFGNNTSGQMGTTQNLTSFITNPEIITIPGLTGTISDIAIGHSHVLIMTSTGRVFCSGNNTLGSCGDSFQDQFNTFTEVGANLGASAIMVHEKTSFAVVSGALQSWGDIVKQGSGVFYNTPAALMGSTSFQKVICGDEVSFGLTPYTSALWGWGKNVGNQLTTSDRMDRHVPFFIPHTAAWNFTDVVASGMEPTYSVAAVRDAQYKPIVGWGRNDWGQQGTDANPPDPEWIGQAAQIITTGVNVTTFRVSLGTTHTVVMGSFSPAVAPIGVHVFGQNNFGQIGQGSSNFNAKRLQLTDGIVDACAGAYHTVWIGDGLLSVMGRNNWGQIGLGTVGQVSQPEQKNITAGVLHKVWCGARSTFVGASDGLYVAGDDTMGALGLGSGSIINTFTKHTFATFFSEGVLKVSAGVAEGQHTLVLTTSGRIFSMGDNSKGQLGIGSFVNSALPTLVAPGGLPSDYKALDVCAGSDHSLIIFGKRFCPNDCKGSGTDPKGTCDTVLGKCNCFDGFLGDSCQLFQCADPICSGYGTCDQNKGLCVCTTNFEGDKCQFRKCPNACSGRGSCDRSAGICTCEAGYVGIDCSTNGASVGFVSLFIVVLSAALLML